MVELSTAVGGVCTSAAAGVAATAETAVGGAPAAGVGAGAEKLGLLPVMLVGIEPGTSALTAASADAALWGELGASGAADTAAAAAAAACCCGDNSETLCSDSLTWVMLPV